MIYVRFVITEMDGKKRPSMWSLVPEVDSFTMTKNGIILWEKGKLHSLLACENVMEISDQKELLTKTKFKAKGVDGKDSMEYEKWVPSEARDMLGRPIP